MTKRYVVATQRFSGEVLIADDGEKAVERYGDQARESRVERAGAALHDAFKVGGADLATANGYAIHEDDAEGTLIATMHPVLEGARAVWLVLYRANREASCFKPLGSRQRFADALDAAFAELKEEIKLPHKP